MVLSPSLKSLPTVVMTPLTSTVNHADLEQDQYEVLNLSLRRSTTDTVTSSDGTSCDFNSDEEIDPEVAQAVARSIKKGSMLPIIKEELRCTIQNRRLAAGHDELVVEYRPKVKRKYTAEEEARVLKRRERNKLAAQRCRNKRRERTEELEVETQGLESVNKELRCEVRGLQHELETLQAIVQAHNMDTCPYVKHNNNNNNRRINNSDAINRINNRVTRPRQKYTSRRPTEPTHITLVTAPQHGVTEDIIVDGEVSPESLADHTYSTSDDSCQLPDSCQEEQPDLELDVETVEIEIC